MHASKSPKEAEDRGYKDGRAYKESKPDFVTELIEPSYKGDRNYPETYRESFKRGSEKKNW